MASELNEQQTAFVGFYLGEARWNATRAADMAGYKHPHVQGPRLLSNVRVTAHIDEWRDETRKRAIANVEYRVAKLDDLENRYWNLIDARAAELADIPGGDTGLLVKVEKVIGTGNSAQQITEYKTDTTITKEIRELHKQAAQELGQWIERNEHAGPNGEALTIVLGERSDGPQ